jgi:N-acetylglucosaminyldiphosphoundecaprenol N-acetyl-beta-D-mannosaminyltransferase
MYLRYGDVSWDSPEAAADAALLPAAQAGGNGRSARVARASAQVPVIRLHGIQLHAVTEASCIQHVLAELEAGRGGVVVTPNLDHLRRCARDMRFGALVAEADLVVADGMPLVWASRLQGTPLPERVAGSDLISSLSAAAAESEHSVFLLGGAPGTAEAAARVLLQRYPELKVTGTHCPPYGFEKDEAAIERIIESLRSAQPEIVYVGLGSPKQELLIERVRSTLPSAWWLGVGNSFSFLCGDVKRAPLWMQKRGLEWVHRLYQEPKRLFKRYVIFGLPFAAALLGRSVVKGLPVRLRGSKAPASVASRSAGAASPSVSAADALVAVGPSPAQAAGPTPAALRNATAVRATGAAVVGAAAIPDVTMLRRLRALVLLGGSVRPTPLASATGRNPLDLPLGENGTILQHWLHHAADVVGLAELANLPVRILVDRHSPEPEVRGGRYEYGTVHVERDHSEYRGTGGVLGDLAADYDDDDLILVCTAAQVLLEPLASITQALVASRGDVAMVAHQDETPSGVMLLTCKTLRRVASTGFVDMKEQALPTIAASGFKVTVVHRRRSTGMPVRSLSDYILALRHYHRRRLGSAPAHDPFAEDWRPTFAIVEDGATVEETARVHDAVVLRGGRVEAGSVLVRSVVCADGILRRNRTAVDQFVTDGGTDAAVARAAASDGRGSRGGGTDDSSGSGKRWA